MEFNFSNENIKIFTKGRCSWLSRAIKELVPDAKIFIVTNQDHRLIHTIIFMYGKYVDIEGYETNQSRVINKWKKKTGADEIFMVALSEFKNKKLRILIESPLEQECCSYWKDKRYYNSEYVILARKCAGIIVGKIKNSSYKAAL